MALDALLYSYRHDEWLLICTNKANKQTNQPQTNLQYMIWGYGARGRVRERDRVCVVNVFASVCLVLDGCPIGTLLVPHLGDPSSTRPGRGPSLNRAWPEPTQP